MKKIISIILLAVIVSTSVLFTGCGGEVAPSNAQTSDETDTTVLSDTTPTADPNQFSVKFYVLISGCQSFNSYLRIRKASRTAFVPLP